MRKQERIKDLRIPRHIEEIKTMYREQGPQPALIAKMKELREVFIEHEQPTIVKSLRLAYEHIEHYGDYRLTYMGRDESLLEEGEEVEAPAEGISPFEYFMDLLANPTNKYNKDEIKEVNLLLKESLEA